MDEEKINHIIQQYKLKKEREYNNYHNVNKLNEDYMIKNKERAKAHYDLHSDDRKLKYKETAEISKAKSSYNYYKKTNNIQKFRDKFPEREKLLTDIGILKGITINFD
tara:strand:- start:508 stop:831 length:324 start_codon:yes stop_codon:yes gene_type:complete